MSLFKKEVDIKSTSSKCRETPLLKVRFLDFLDSLCQVFFTFRYKLDVEREFQCLLDQVVLARRLVAALALLHQCSRRMKY